jgi:hypothetical protein
MDIPTRRHLAIEEMEHSGQYRRHDGAKRRHLLNLCAESQGLLSPVSSHGSF